MDITHETKQSEHETECTGNGRCNDAVQYPTAQLSDGASAVRTPGRCPRCNGSEIYPPYGLEGLRERIAALALRFPVECGSCGLRFHLSVMTGDIVLVLNKSHLIFGFGALLLVCGAAFLAGMTVGLP